MTQHFYVPTDPTAQAMMKRDRATAEIRRLGAQIRAAKAVGNKPRAGRLQFQKQFVWQAALEEALAQLDKHRAHPGKARVA